MANEINENHHHDRENICGGECRNKKCKRRQQTCFQVNDDDAREDVDVDCGRADRPQSVIDLLARRHRHLPHCDVQHRLLPRIQHQKKRRAHHQGADREKQENAGNFSEHIFEAGHRFGENGVNGAVLNVLGNEPRGGDDCQQRGKDRHRPERNIFQDLKFLLKSELRHEDRAADQKQSEDQQDVKNFQARQFGQRIERDGKNARERKSAISRCSGRFIAHDLVEKQFFQARCRSSARDQFRVGSVDQGFNFFHQTW